MSVSASEGMFTDQYAVESSLAYLKRYVLTEHSRL